jgi:hypothetical protein
MSLCQQVVHGGRSRRDVVDVDPALRQVLVGAPEAGEGDRALGDEHKPRVVWLQAGEDEAVHSSRSDQILRIGHVVLRGGQHDVVIAAPGRHDERLDELDGNGVAGIELDRRHGMGQLHGSPRPQTACSGMRRVLKCLDGPDHAPSSVVAEPTTLVDHVRHGLPRNLGESRHVVDGRATLAASRGRSCGPGRIPSHGLSPFPERY